MTQPSDALMAHAVKLLQKPDDSAFSRWADICDDLFIVDSSGNTLLHWAAALGQLKMIKFLVQTGLDLEHRNGRAATPLLCAAASCRNPGSVIGHLIRQGASTDVKNDAGDDVFSLLKQRGLGRLATVFQALEDTMEGCPRLYSRSGYDSNDSITFQTSAVDLGTREALAPRMSTVRFKIKRDADDGDDDMAVLGDTLHTRSDSEEVADQTRGGWSFTLDDTHTARDQILAAASGEYSGAADRMLPLTLEEMAARTEVMLDQATECNALMATVLQFTVALYNGLAQEVFTSDDEDEEGEDANDDDGGLSRRDQMMRLHDPEEALTMDPVAAVLGERHDADGRRVMLVQWRRSSTAINEALPGESGDGVDWVPLEDVNSSPVVQRYLERYDNTYTNTALHGDEDKETTFGLDVSSSQRAMDDEERQELEEMLGMIPRRQLSPEPSAATVSSESHSFVLAAAQKERKGSRENPESGELLGQSNSEEIPPMMRTVVHEHRGTTVTESVMESDVEEEDRHRLNEVQWSTPQNASSAGVAAAQDPSNGAAPQAALGAERVIMVEAPPRRFVAPSVVKRSNGDVAELMGSDMTAVQSTNDSSAPSSSVATNPPVQYQLSSSEQITYQKFLYQSAMERLRARTGDYGAAYKQK